MLVKCTVYWNIYFGFFCFCFGTNDEHFWWREDCFHSQLQYIDTKFLILNNGFFKYIYTRLKIFYLFFNKSCKVSINLVHIWTQKHKKEWKKNLYEKKRIPTQKQWNFAQEERTKLIHEELRTWSCCKQMNFVIQHGWNDYHKELLLLDGRRSCPILMSISRTSEIPICLSVEKLSCLAVFTMSYVLRY